MKKLFLFLALFTLGSFNFHATAKEEVCKNGKCYKPYDSLAECQGAISNIEQGCCLITDYKDIKYVMIEWGSCKRQGLEPARS